MSKSISRKPPSCKSLQNKSISRKLPRSKSLRSELISFYSLQMHEILGRINNPRPYVTFCNTFNGGELTSVTFKITFANAIIIVRLDDDKWLINQRNKPMLIMSHHHLVSTDEFVKLLKQRLNCQS